MRRSLGLLRSWAIYYGNPFNTRRLRQLYGQFLGPGDLYFDIGAHVGNRVGAALAVGARVVALEPNPTLMKVLDSWYGSNSSVHLVQKAIGQQREERTLYISERTPTVSSVSKEWIELVKNDQSFEGVRWDSAVTVKVTTLDELIDQFGTPGYCKIDIEGHELEALKGLTRSLPMISFEFLPVTVALSRQCIQQIEELGRYEYNWSIAEQSRLQAPQWVGGNEIISILGSRLQTGKSGDIYARRKQ